MTVTTSDPRVWVEALRESHDRLSKLVSDLDVDELGSRSYDSEWSIAQVLSHLGSQAEIFSMFLDAGLAGASAPGVEAFHPVWDSWNARGPGEHRDDSVAANEALVARLEGLDPEQVASFRLDLFGNDIDLAGFGRMRLSEHAVHAWDVAVALDSSATVEPDAVELLVDGLDQLAARVGKPAAEPFRVRVRTTAPDRDLVVSVGSSATEPGGGVVIEPADQGAYDGSVALPAEAYLRLVYGRLDAEHTPAVIASGSRGLDDLRQVFPGV